MPKDNVEACVDTLVIPNDRREEVRSLARRHMVAKIAHECAINRYRNAVEDGEFEQAVLEFDAGYVLEEDRVAAKDAFWACIQEMFPDTDIDCTEWSYDSKLVLLKRDDPRNGLMEILQTMAGRGDEQSHN